jgi:hypothetical protein
MPLNPLIPLQAQGITIQTPNLLQTMLQTAQLREMQQQQQLREAQYRDYLLKQQQRQALMAPGGLLEQAYKGLGGGPVDAGIEAPPVPPSPLRPQAPMAPQDTGGITQGPLTPEPPLARPLGPQAPFAPGQQPQAGQAAPLGPMAPAPLQRQGPPLPGQQPQLGLQGQPQVQPGMGRQPVTQADRTAQQFALYGRILAQHGEAAVPYVSQLLSMQKEYADQRKQEAEQGKLDAEAQSKRQEMGLNALKQTAELWESVQAAPDKDKQDAYSLARDMSSLLFPDQMAARIPAQYNPQFVDQMARQAVSAKDRMDLDIRRREAAVKEGGLGVQQGQLGLNTRETVVKESAEQRMGADFQRKQNQPNYGLGDRMDAALYYLHGAELGPGGKPTPEMVGNAQRLLQRYEVEKAQQTQAVGLGNVAQKTFEAAVSKPLDESARVRLNGLLQAEEVAKTLATEFTPEERARYVGLGGLRMGAQQAQQLLADANDGKADPKFARFAALLAVQAREAFDTAGKALTNTEKGVVFGYIPTGKEWSSTEFESKLQLANDRIPKFIDRDIELSTTSAKDVATRRRSQTITEDDIQETLKDPRNKGRTRDDILRAAQAKGFRLWGQ